MVYGIEPFFVTDLGQLFQGDCLEIMDFLIEQNYKFDAIITDPPYEVTNYDWDQLIPFDEMWNKLLKLIKDDGAIVLFGNEPFSSNLRKSNDKLYRYDWKWIKNQVTGFQNAKYQPLRCYEDIMIFSKSSAVVNAKSIMCYYPQEVIKVHLKNTKQPINYLRGKKVIDKVSYIQEYANFPRNVLQFARETSLFHPTQKPISLLEYLVRTYTKENEIVLDFTAGSGSTLLACEITNRKWVGIEISKKYCEVIKERFKNVQLKMLFDSNQKREDVKDE